jgi:hypothetical protein
MIEKRNDYGSQKEFNDFTIVEVWRKAIPYKSFELYKKDIYGSLIFFDDYGIKSENGWMIAQIISNLSVDKNDIVNLQPVHWKNMEFK